MHPRGQIRNRHFARQLNDFSGFAFGRITPTDIDGIIEYRDKAYVIIEVKYKEAELPYGQRLCLERLTDDLAKVKPALCIVCNHNTPCSTSDCDDVKLKDCQVRCIRFDGMWRYKQAGENALELVTRFLNYVSPTKAVCG